MVCETWNLLREIEEKHHLKNSVFSKKNWYFASQDANISKKNTFSIGNENSKVFHFYLCILQLKNTWKIIWKYCKKKQGKHIFIQWNTSFFKIIECFLNLYFKFFYIASFFIKSEFYKMNTHRKPMFPFWNIWKMHTKNNFAYFFLLIAYKGCVNAYDQEKFNTNLTCCIFRRLTG